MKHEELLAICKERSNIIFIGESYKALRGVVELHKPFDDDADECGHCGDGYPCITIQVIEKELE